MWWGVGVGGGGVGGGCVGGVVGWVCVLLLGVVDGVLWVRCASVVVLLCFMGGRPLGFTRLWCGGLVRLVSWWWCVPGTMVVVEWWWGCVRGTVVVGCRSGACVGLWWWWCGPGSMVVVWWWSVCPVARWLRRGRNMAVPQR